MPIVEPITNTDPDDGSVVYASATDAAELGLTGLELERALLLSEAHVDLLLGSRPASPTTGLKLDPAAMTAPRRRWLARAVVAQAAYNLAHPDELAGLPQVLEEQGPDFRLKYAEAIRTDDGAPSTAPETRIMVARLALEPYVAVSGARATP